MTFVAADGHAAAIHRDAFTKALPADEQDLATGRLYVGDRMMER
jgi:hypothetical protein